MTSQEIMIDIETLSTKSNAAILTIAALKFSREDSLKNINEYETFYKRITRSSTADFDVDPATVEWWSKQNSEAKFEALESTDRIDLKPALEELILFFGDISTVWSKSPDFDCVILTTAFASCGLESPWKFYNTRCVRTIMDLANVKNWEVCSRNQHNAVFDCYGQIEALKMSFAKLGLGNQKKIEVFTPLSVRPRLLPSKYKK